MAAKFAEDERIEQLNAQQRRMKEQEHKREIERLWSDKITAYREQRDQEWEDRRIQKDKETAYQEAITEYKQKMLDEH